MDVSILIPTHNRAHVLGECIDSILAQRCTASYEIVVVDDASTDDTAVVVRARADAADARGVDLRYVTQPPGGANAARNTAIKNARGDLFVFVDDDVEAPEGWLAAIVDGAARHPDALGFAGPIRLRVEGHAPRTCSNEALATELDLGQTERPVTEAWTANAAYRRRAFDLIGPFEEKIPAGAGDEEQWLIRLLDRGGVVIYLPAAWLWHRRVATDLIFKNMLKGKFRRGYHQAPFFRWAGREGEFTVAKDLAHAARWVGHGVRRGCAGGILEAAQCIGRIWGTLRNKTVLPGERVGRA